MALRLVPRVETRVRTLLPKRSLFANPERRSRRLIAPPEVSPEGRLHPSGIFAGRPQVRTCPKACSARSGDRGGPNQLSSIDGRN